MLLPEPRRARGSTLRAVVAVPGAVRDGLRLVAARVPCSGLTGVSLLWGVGMPAFETLLPARLAQEAGGPVAARIGLVAAAVLAAATPLHLLRRSPAPGTPASSPRLSSSSGPPAPPAPRPG